MDTLGAIVGPTTATALLTVLKDNYTPLFLLTLIPGLAATVAIAVLVQEKDRLQGSRLVRLATLPKKFRRFLVGVGLFGAGDFAHTMLRMLGSFTVSRPLSRQSL
jgi:MFS family permease